MADKPKTRDDKRAAALRDNLMKRKAFVKGSKAKASEAGKGEDSDINQKDE